MKFFKRYNRGSNDNNSFVRYFYKRNLWLYLIPIFVVSFISFYTIVALSHPEWSYRIYETHELKYTQSVNTAYQHLDGSPVYNITVNISYYSKKYPDVIYSTSLFYRDTDSPEDIYVLKKWKETKKYYSRKAFWSGLDSTNSIQPAIILLFTLVGGIIITLTLIGINEYYDCFTYDERCKFKERYNRKIDRRNLRLLKLYIRFYRFMGISEKVIEEAVHDANEELNSYEALTSVTLGSLKKSMCETV